MAKRFFYGGEKIIRVISVDTWMGSNGKKFVTVKLLKDFGSGPMEISQGFYPEEWIVAERELMDMHVPGVEADLFD